MNATKALFWKEGREILYKIFLGLGGCIALLLLRQHPEFEQEFVRNLESWGMWVGIISAVVLGMEAVATERNKGTLDFLMGRPIPAAKLMLVKFATGGASLFLVIAAFWATVYLFPLAQNPVDYDYFQWIFNQRILTNVGYPYLVLIWFTLMFQLYAFVFLGSSLTDNLLKTIASGVLIVWILAIMMILGAFKSNPSVSFYLTHFVDTGWDGWGTIVRIVREKGLLAGRLIFVGLFTAGIFWLSVLSLRRWKGGALGWWPILIAWGVTGGMFLLGGYLRGEESFPEPVGLWTPRKQAERVETKVEETSSTSMEDMDAAVMALMRKNRDQGMMRDMALQDDVAFVALRKGLVTIDVSQVEEPREIGKILAKHWEMQKIALAGSAAYIFGELKRGKEDSVGVAIFDIEDPTAPEMRGQFSLDTIGRAGSVRYLEYLGATGDVLYIGLQRDFHHVELLALDIRDRWNPIVRNKLVLDVDFGQADGMVKLSGPNESMGFRMTVDGHLAFIGMETGLVIVDLSDPDHPEVLSNTRLEELSHRISGSRRRMILVEGNRAYVERYWPREMVVMDISDPRQPVELDYIRGLELYEQDTAIFGESIYSKRSWGITSHEILDSGRVGKVRKWKVDTEVLESQFMGYYSRPGLSIKDGFAYTIIADYLMIFSLDE